VIEDSSYVWWAIRPSLKLPTLELRAPDCCTRVDDSVAIASLYRALVRRLARSPWLNSDLDAVGRAIVIENKWRAQRYGVHGTVIEESGLLTIAEKLEQVIEETTPDAEALGCLVELHHCREVVSGGTSADMQLAIFEAHEQMKDREQALRAVTDWIASATLQ
jgi:carboxylate-amine ligase